MGGGKGGGGGSSSNAALNTQARIANQMFSETEGIRHGLIDDSTAFVTGFPDLSAVDNFSKTTTGVLPEDSPVLPPMATDPGGVVGVDPTFQRVSSSPVFSAEKSIIEQQFENANRSFLRNSPTGGVMVEGMADLEAAKAGALSESLANAFRDEQNRAFSLATGLAPITLNSLGQSGSAQAALAGANAQASATAAAGKGQGLGMLAGALLA